MGKTLYEKIYDSHVVYQAPGELPTLYVDRHLVHEVTSPQAFAGLRAAGRKLRRPEDIIATVDHDISTREQSLEACMPTGREQVKALLKNTKDFNVTFYGFNHPNQGIVHIIGPQVGFTLPGTVLVCGDSHTATHGAFGALAFGIGTSEVEHVMATETIKQQRYRTMKIECRGRLQRGCSAKDLILAIIARLTTAGATGYSVEYCGEAVSDLSMEGRMTLSNMAIEFGATSGLVAPDEKTFEYLKGRELAPKGKDFEDAVKYWKTLRSDPDARYDKVVVIEADKIEPQVTWGTNPGQGCAVTGRVPSPEDFEDPVQAKSCERALAYQGFTGGQKIAGVPVDYVFIGSCTNGRLEDFVNAAKILKGRHIAKNIQLALAVPGSQWVRSECEKLGIDKIFKQAGFEWREPGCSMCLAMNDDRAPSGVRVASTSNRNFVGRQGKGSKTHLMSPAMAAAAAVEGAICDVRKFL